MRNGGERDKYHYKDVVSHDEEDGLTANGYDDDDNDTGRLISSSDEEGIQVDSLLPRKGPKPSCHQQFTDFSNVFKAFIGSSLIGLPFAIRNAGIVLGLIGILIIALATDHCCNLIVKCKQIVIKKICEQMAADGYANEHIRKQEQHLGRTLSFGKIGKMTMGKIGVILVNTSILITQFGFCTGYFIFLGNTGRSVLFELIHFKEIPASTINQSFPILPTNISLLTNDSIYTTGSTILQQNMSKSTFNSTNTFSSNSMVKNMKNPFSHASLQENNPWTFALLLNIPAPLLILVAFIRNIRKLGPISVLANGAITGAFLATGIYILVGFESPHETIVWFDWLKFPVFFGQVTGAYEGIGTVIPIEGSMADNRHRYPCYLHISLCLLSTILGSFGVLGYLRFGNETNQIVTENLQGSVIVIILRCLLFFGVLFTYPLQIYPVIQIVEGILFRSNKKRNIGKRNAVVNAEFENSSSMSGMLQSNDDNQTITVKIPVWQSNILRTFLVLCTAVVAVAFRSQFAYIIALTGSIGSSLLSYILPCLFHIILKRKHVSKWIIAKDIGFIIFGVIGGIMGMTITIMEIIRTFGKHHPIHHS